MNRKTALDCIVIGYNETPFEEYEALIRQYGEDSETYRDLKFNFVDIQGKKYNYVDLLNYVFRQAGKFRSNSPDQEFKSGDIPNLAAVYLTNFLRNRSFDTAYINLFQYEKAKLADYLSQNPLCVAITTTFYILNQPVIEMVRFIREHNPQVKIIVGGPLVSNHYRRCPPEELPLVLDDIGADVYVIDSQGELTLSQVVECLKNGDDLRSVPNIIYADKGTFRSSRLILENNSLDENYIAWDSFDTADLGPTLQTRTARSCAFSCAFCAYPLRAGKLTLASLETIEKELDSMQRIGARNVVFIDDTFNVPLKRFKEICQLMIKKDYQFNWFSYFRCSNSDDEAIELMARAGCKGVFLGIESGSPTMLKHMHKAAAADQYRHGIKTLRENGILTFGSFITGFPGETAETVQETLDFIKDTKLDFYRSMLWYCEPGTPIYDKREEYAIHGDGFRWEHATMESLEAMDHIDRLFLAPKESIWLPQWSFDFWFIPYILGKGMTLPQFRSFLQYANQLLALEIAYLPQQQKALKQQEYLQQMISMVQTWA